MMTVEARRLTATCLAILALSNLPPSAAAQTDPGRPARLAIEPNAILRDDRPLEIEVEGIPEDDRATIWVVRDCDGDGRPDDGPDCPRILEQQSEPADRHGVARHRFEFDRLEVEFPRGVSLWLRAARPGSEQFRQAMFGFAFDECSLFRTVAEAFLGGDCDPGLVQVLRHHREPSDLASAVFEVRRLAVDEPSAEPSAVSRTRGASGVAWFDDETLLVTAAGVAGEGNLEAGLYRLPLAPGAGPERLWRPGEGTDEGGAAAPLALAGGRVAFVRQALGPQHAGAGPEVARLIVLRLDGGEIERRVALPYKVHQLLAAGAGGTSVLALSLGVGDNQPVFLRVSLEDGVEPEVLGFANALYQSAMREPGGERSVVAFENAFGGRGWQLVLAEGKKLTRDLVKRDGRHDLAPAWRPSGGELAFLAQVGVVE